jgi:hypothetical protein
MGNTKSRFICQVCNKFLRNPVKLRCECNMCHEHLDEIFSNENSIFQCKNCKTKTNKSDLKENQNLNLELEQNHHLDENVRKIKVKFETKLEELKLNETELSIKIYEHFYAIKNDIDIKRETILQSSYRENEETDDDNDTKVIQRLSANLIERAEMAEKMFRKNLHNQIKSEKLFDAFRDPTLTMNQAKELYRKCDTFSISYFERRLKNYKFVESKLNLNFQFGELYLDDLPFG